MGVGGLEISALLVSLIPAMVATVLVGGQGGGCGAGGVQATCFYGALLPIVIWSGAIKKLSGWSSRRQMAPSLPRVDVGGLCPGDRWRVGMFCRYFMSLVA